MGEPNQAQIRSDPNQNRILLFLVFGAATIAIAVLDAISMYSDDWVRCSVMGCGLYNCCVEDECDDIIAKMRPGSNRTVLKMARVLTVVLLSVLSWLLLSIVEIGAAVHQRKASAACGFKQLLPLNFVVMAATVIVVVSFSNFWNTFFSGPNNCKTGRGFDGMVGAMFIAVVMFLTNLIFVWIFAATKVPPPQQQQQEQPAEAEVETKTEENQQQQVCFTLDAPAAPPYPAPEPTNRLGQLLESHCSAASPSPFAYQVLDAINEPTTPLAPICGIMKTPELSLKDAVLNLPLYLLDDALIAKSFAEKCVGKPTNMTVDQCAAIRLYTFGRVPVQHSFFYFLNLALRSEDRAAIVPFFPYLKLLLTGLRTLPPVQGTFYRGFLGPLPAAYKPDEEVTWWGFSTCTQRFETLSNVLVQAGQRVLFAIESGCGYDIRSFSASVIEEGGVLLLPGSVFKVIDVFEVAPEVTMVRLKHLRDAPSLLS